MLLFGGSWPQDSTESSDNDEDDDNEDQTYGDGGDGDNNKDHEEDNRMRTNCQKLIDSIPPDTKIVR